MLAGIAASRASLRKDLRGSAAFELGDELRLRFDQHAGPAALLEVECLRPKLGPIGADLDEVAPLDMTEESAFQLILGELRKNRTHGVPWRTPNNTPNLARCDSEWESWEFAYRRFGLPTGMRRFSNRRLILEGGIAWRHINF